MAMVAVGTSAIARGISAGSGVDQQFSAASQSVLGGMWVLTFTPSQEGKGLAGYPLAYVDPGTGQLILQMAVAACVGALFYLKRIRVFFRKLVDKWFKKH
ncbi:MAG: hypothetical protein ABSH21_11045 [Verrucomicrobiia bacterium]|jgi:hypothetical protein